MLDRFLSIRCYRRPGYESYNLFFDLQSFKLSEEGFSYDYYKYDSDEFVAEYKKTHNYLEEHNKYIYADIDGYPTKCIKCSKITSLIYGNGIRLL